MRMFGVRGEGAGRSEPAGESPAAAAAREPAYRLVGVDGTCIVVVHRPPRDQDVHMVPI